MAQVSSYGSCHGQGRIRISKFVHESFGFICRENDLRKNHSIVVELYAALNIMESNWVLLIITLTFSAYFLDKDYVGDLSRAVWCCALFKNCSSRDQDSQSGKKRGTHKIGSRWEWREYVSCARSQNHCPGCCQGECYRSWSPQLRLDEGNGCICVLWWRTVSSKRGNFTWE